MRHKKHFSLFVPIECPTMLPLQCTASASLLKMDVSCLKITHHDCRRQKVLSFSSRMRTVAKEARADDTLTTTKKAPLR